MDRVGKPSQSADRAIGVKNLVSGSRGRSRGVGWGELARNDLIVVHGAGLFLLHAVAHDIEYEIHREIGGNRDLNGGELRSLVVEI